MKLKGLILFIIICCNAIVAYSNMSFDTLEKSKNLNSEQIETLCDFSSNVQFTFTPELEEDDDANDNFMHINGIDFTFSFLIDFTSKQPFISCIKEFLKPPCLF